MHHPRSMVPHHTRDIEKGALQDSLTYLRSGDASHPVDRMTTETALFGKEPTPFERIAGKKKRRGLIRSKYQPRFIANTNNQNQGEEHNFAFHRPLPRTASPQNT